MTWQMLLNFQKNLFLIPLVVDRGLFTLLQFWPRPHLLFIQIFIPHWYIGASFYGIMVVYENFFPSINIFNCGESSNPAKSRMGCKIKLGFDLNKIMVYFVSQCRSVVSCIPIRFQKVDLYHVSKIIFSKSNQISVCCISGMMKLLDSENLWGRSAVQW